MIITFPFPILLVDILMEFVVKNLLSCEVHCLFHLPVYLGRDSEVMNTSQYPDVSNSASCHTQLLRGGCGRERQGKFPLYQAD